VGFDSAPSTQQGRTALQNRKRKPGDRIAGPDTHDQGSDVTNSPSPPQCARPRKKGRLSYRSKPLTTYVDEGVEDQSGEVGGGGVRWTDAELRRFIHALMGPDGYWEKFRKNPTNVFKKVSAMVDNEITTPPNFMSRLRRGSFLVASMQRL